MSTGGMTMRRRLMAFGRIAALMIVLLLRLPSLSDAEVFWTDDFENHLMPNWDTTWCGAQGALDGCGNSAISTNVAKSGTHSLKSHYDQQCGMNPATSPGCGAYYDRQHTLTSELWVLFNYYTVNFTYFEDTKLLYTRQLPGGSGDSNPVLVWKADRTMVIAAITEPAHQCPDGRFDSDCRLVPSVFLPFQDDRWYCVEFHV